MKRREPSQTVSFRASADLVRLIDRERAPFELSRGTFVRGLVSTQLVSVQQQESNAKLDQLFEMLESLDTARKASKREQQRFLFVMLTRIGGLDPDEAKQLVRQVFPPQQELQ